MAKIYKKQHMNVQTDQDVLNKHGQWAKSWTITTEELSIQNHTRSGALWADVQKRCKVGGRTQVSNPTYIGCENKFTDFHSFSCWAQEQYGYLSRNDNGKFWSLDKDIIQPFNKVYSEHTCCFVPAKLNTLLLYNNGGRTELPMGVSKHHYQECFIALCVGEYLGVYKDPFEGHRAWQKARIKTFDNALSEFSFMPTKVLEGLERHKNLIIDDYENHRETIR